MNTITYYKINNEKFAESYLLEASYLNCMDRKEDAIRAIDMVLSVVSDTAKRTRFLVVKANIFDYIDCFSHLVLRKMTLFAMSKV